MTGSPRTFDLWFVRPEEVQGPVLLERFRALLTTEERARNQRFRQERHRHQDLVTRALVRHVLSQYATDLHPAEWIFSENHHGKPAIAGPAGAPRLSFNLSHTDGMLLCGVTQHHPVGVDVERVDRKTEVGAIAERFFSESEVSALLALPEHAQRQRFFDYWTLKEAYIKARGMGLALPLGDFSFALGGDGRVRISFSERIDDEPDAWQFSQFRLSPTHLAAVAIRHGDDSPLEVQVRPWVFQ